MNAQNYWKETHTPLYSFIFTLPLFLIYEIGVFAISTSDLPLLRNGADALMRQILEKFVIDHVCNNDSRNSVMVILRYSVKGPTYYYCQYSNIIICWNYINPEN